MKLLRSAVVLLVAGLTAAACTGADAPAPPPAPVPTSSTSASPPPASPPTPTSGRPLRSTGSAGTDGLTIRYQGGDGRIDTLRVEDFPR